MGVIVFFLWTQMVAFQVVVDKEKAVAVAVYPAGYAVVVAGGVFDVDGIAEEGATRKYGYAAALQREVGRGIEPALVAGEEAFVEFLQADDVSVGYLEKA